MNRRKYGYGFYFKCIQSSIEKHMNETLKDFDLTMSQEKVLRFLRWTKLEKVSQKDIKEFYHISNPTVTGILNRLEQKGYIRRVISDSDKRVHYIESTEKALELEKAVQRSVKLIEAKLVEGLQPDEKEMLFILLEKVTNNVIEKEEV